MRKKEVLREVFLVLSWLWLYYNTIKFLLVERDIANIIGICMYFFSMELYFKIKRMVRSYKLYKVCKNELAYLKAVHTERYKLYFTGTKEKVEEYSAEIERYGTALLNICETSISNNLLSKKHTQKVKEILNQTKNLMTTVH